MIIAHLYNDMVRTTSDRPPTGARPTSLVWAMTGRAPASELVLQRGGVPSLLFRYLVIKGLQRVSILIGKVNTAL